MVNEFKFSVGIPAYKGRYLSECIASILDQSYAVYELIIVNDCSPDRVDEIVGKFNDTRIRYFKNNKNEGAEFVANNYNRCLEKARGDFFILMGDDDKMAPGYLEEFSILITKFPGLDVFHCRSKIIDEHSNPVIYTPSWPEYESIYDNIWHRMNGYRVQFIADYVYRLSTLNNNGGFYYMPLGWYTDDITSYIAMANKGIAHTNKPVLNYRNHPVNISSSGSHEIKMKAVIAQHNWFKEFLLNKPEFKEDIITYDNLCKTINKLIQRHKFEVISSSLDNDFIKNYLGWLKKRKDYGISIFEITYSVFRFIRNKRGEKKIKKTYYNNQATH